MKRRNLSDLHLKCWPLTWLRFSLAMMTFACRLHANKRMAIPAYPPFLPRLRKTFFPRDRLREINRGHAHLQTDVHVKTNLVAKGDLRAWADAQAARRECGQRRRPAALGGTAPRRLDHGGFRDGRFGRGALAAGF